MIRIIKELNIEVTKPNVFQALVAKQYDMNTRFLKVTLTDCGAPITVPYLDKITVVINAERKDGQSKGFDGVVNEDGTVTVPLHSWMLELEGEVKCDISVIDTTTDDNKKLTTTSFDLLVEKAAYGGDDITSDPQYDVLVELIERVENLENGVVDQTYNPNSPNAQSGKAVNEALSVFEEIPTDETITFAPYDYEKIYDASHNGIYEITEIYAEDEYTWLNMSIGSINISKPSFLLPDLTVGSKIYIEFGEQWALDGYYLNKLAVVKDKYITKETFNEALTTLEEFSNSEGSLNYVPYVSTSTTTNGTYTITGMEGDGINYLCALTEFGYFQINNPTYKVAVGDKIYVEFGEPMSAPDGIYYFNKLALVKDKFVTEEVLQESISETWDTICDFELGEDAVVQISYDELNGIPINLKKFKILVQMPTVTSATTVWLKVNKILAMFTQPSSASGTPAYSINGEYTYEWQLSTCAHPANAFNSSPIYTTPYGHRYASGGIPFPCTSIGLALNSAFTQGLPEGARIRIWGVRA